MSPLSRTLKKTEDLVKMARVSAAEAVADEFRQSLPIPSRTPDGMCLKFFFCPALARPQQPVRLEAPKYLLTLRAESGTRDELRPVSPTDLGLREVPDSEIGTFAMPEGMTFQAFTMRLTELYAAYDVLLPAFARGTTKVGKEVQHAARNYQTLFDLLSEPPLRAYYQVAGQEFFEWVDQAAR